MFIAVSSVFSFNPFSTHQIHNLLQPTERKIDVEFLLDLTTSTEAGAAKFGSVVENAKLLNARSAALEKYLKKILACWVRDEKKQKFYY